MEATINGLPIDPGKTSMLLSRKGADWQRKAVGNYTHPYITIYTERFKRIYIKPLKNRGKGIHFLFHVSYLFSFVEIIT